MTWDRVKNFKVIDDGDYHYSVLRLNENSNGMDLLKSSFPNGEVNSLNFVLFSTSGVHGSYFTIEEVEEEPINEENEKNSVTFLIINPRIVCLRYGVCYPESKEDFEFLKILRQNSMNVISTIGF